jgi:hypothetical protein
MTRCSENLHRLVGEQRLRHPGDAELDRHADSAQIDGVIALTIAAERAERPSATVELLGFV